MKFACEAVTTAAGAVLVHTLRGEGVAFKKGRRLSMDDVARLARAGVNEVMVARFDADDVPEDEAAAAIAAACAGPGLSAAAAFTGRCNLYATAAGIALVDAARLARLNAVDEAITVATLPPFTRVEARQMVATVKIIPFAVPRQTLEHARAQLVGGDAALAVAAFRPRRVALIQTTLPAQKPSLPLATRTTMAARLAEFGSTLGQEAVVAHRADAVAAALCRLSPHDLVLIVGASAIVDRRDVIPSAIVAAGGRIERLGMPVEPGNLLLLARLGETPVIGLPGCARSPKLNGFDWVLERLCAGVAVDSQAIAAMGVGGLLVASGERRPRRPGQRPFGASTGLDAGRAPAIAAIVLAAGRGSRFGNGCKLAAPYGGEPLLRRAVNAARGAGAEPVIVVLGHAQETLRPLLADLSVTTVLNPDYEDGLARSLAVGLAAVPAAADGTVVLLGDMPRVTARHVQRLIAAFDPPEGRSVCVATHAGRRGNPVVWARSLFTELAALKGDEGGRRLFERFADRLCEVEMDDDGVLFDVDRAEDLAPSPHGG